MMLTTEALTLLDLRARILEATASTKEKLPWLKLATFGDKRTDDGSLRHNANVTLSAVWSSTTTERRCRSTRPRKRSRRRRLAL